MSAGNPPKQVRRTGEPYGVSVILLAGGVGKRMGSKIPKQLLKLQGLTILERSLIALSDFSPQVTEIIVVLDTSLRESTSGGQACMKHPLVKFADPGKERVDSVESAIAVASPDATLYCIHDAARPLVRYGDICNVINDAWKFGAAVLAVPCKATIKSSNDSEVIDVTLDRSKLWEMQTPQVIDSHTLKAGFLKANNSVAPPVTDDVSLVELLGLPVRITQGSYDNIKITTPEDILFANAVLQAAQLELAESAAEKH